MIIYRRLNVNTSTSVRERAEKEIHIDHKQSGDDALLYMISTDGAFQMVTLTTAEAGSEGRLVDLLTGEVFLPSGYGTDSSVMIPEAGR